MLSNQQLIALEKSIRHWDCICQGLEASRGGDGCALCFEFADFYCNGCPVKELYYHGCKGEFGFSAYTSYHDPYHTIPRNSKLTRRYAWLQGVAFAETILINLLNLLPPNHPWEDQQ